MRFSARPKFIEDYNDVYNLWSATTGMGMGMRSLDDSLEGITRFMLGIPIHALWLNLITKLQV